MFQQMIADLAAGKLPDTKLLHKRFEAALVKKLAVIRTPCSFWTADTKINPPAKHLLWAATLLEDKENFKVVEAIIAAELEEVKRAKGQSVSLQDLGREVRQLLDEYQRELIDLTPEILRRDLEAKAIKVFTA